VASTVAGALAPAAGANTPTLLPAAGREISFVVDGTTTYGTLHVPTHFAGQHLAAALLLPGSGPIDRSGNEGPSYDPNTLALIADLFGDEGVMTYRFDKYFSGQAGGRVFASGPGRIVLSDFIAQANAAYQVLRDQPETRPAPAAIAGHSDRLAQFCIGATRRPRLPSSASTTPSRCDRVRGHDGDGPAKSQ
jgi:uncharacterized protein